MAFSLGHENISLLLEKNPELFFLLEYGENQEGVSERRDIESIKQEVKNLPLDELSTLYIYGISLQVGPLFISWLSEKKERRLIFLLDDLKAFRQFLEDADPSFIAHPQIVFFHFSDLTSSVQTLVSQFPCDRVEMISCVMAKESFCDTLRLELLRKSTVAHALFSETVQGHKLLENTLANIPFWANSFLVNRWKDRFARTPAIICGAGPSLEKEIESLRKLEDKALIFAGGSTITALTAHGILPHLCFAIDPNPEEFSRLKEAARFSLPLVYGTRLEKGVLPCFGGDLGYVISDTGGPVERYFEEVLGLSEPPIGPELGMEALSVTTLALAICVHMGCDPILFCGVDLAYTGGKRYASSVLTDELPSCKESDMRSAERLVIKSDIHGNQIQTLVKWVMESECISAFAKKMSPTRFINVSEGGLGFEGVENRSLSELIDAELFQSFDLRGKVHAQIQESRLPLSSRAILQEFEKVQKSLAKLLILMDEILIEIARVQKEGLEFPSARFSFLEMKMQEEVAFSCLNLYVGPVLDRLVDRKHIGQTAVIRAHLKYRQWQKLIERQADLFSDLGLFSCPGGS